MKQYVKQFDNYERRLDYVINDYLEEHPGYQIERIFTLVNTTLSDKVLVVFNVQDKSDRVVEDLY